MLRPAAMAGAVIPSAIMPAGVEADNEDDSISTTSTLSSEQQSEYEVETVFAEKRFPDGMKYLVKWAGYPMARCSWEPEECFNDPATLFEWYQKKKDVQAGRAAPFDHDEWQNQQDAREQAKLDRRQRREEKRKRIQLRGQKRDYQTALDATYSPHPTSTAERPDLHPRRQSPSRFSPSLSRPRIRTSPPKVPPILFGTGQSQRSIGPLRLRKASNGEPSKHFNLSTKRRYEKAKTDEPAPDINQMELFRPSEWPARSSIGAAKIGPVEGLSKTDKSDELPMRNGSSASTYYNQRPRSSFVDPSLPTHASPDLGRSRPPQGSFNRSSGHYGDRQNPMLGDKPVVPQRRPGLGSIRTQNGRFFNPGEVLVDLYYGPEKVAIGHARICGLTQETKNRILSSKTENTIDIVFQHLCTLEDYDRLCYHTANHNYCTGWVEGFDDTEPTICRMAQDLAQRNLLAVSIPFSGFQNVLLAYPPYLRDFRFLHSNFEGRSGVPLYLTARSPLGPIERLGDRMQGNQAFTRMEPRPTVPGPVDETPCLTNAQGEVSNNYNAVVPKATALHPTFPGVEPHETQSASYMHPTLSPSSDKLSDSFGEPMEIHRPPPPPMAPTSAVAGSDHEQSLPGLPGTDQGAANFDLVAFFERQYEVTFSMLLDSKQTAGFYVMYPGHSGNADQQFYAQCEILMAFLEKHTSQTYSSRQSKDWETFTLMERGVALFHKNFVDFSKLPSLSNLLQKNMSFWSFSLSAQHDYGGRSAYFQRIFPPRSIFLLTEDVMLRKLEKTIAFLSWFRDNSKKKFPGTWKIMVRPNILEWVLKQFDKQHPSKRGLWITMHQLISELGLTTDADGDADMENGVISPNVPSYSSSVDGQRPEKANGLTEEQKRADRMAEFFAGWALVNLHQFRRFVIVSGIEPLPRWKEWQHMIIYHGYRGTMATYKIDYEYYWSKLGGQKGGPSTEEKI